VTARSPAARLNGSGEQLRVEPSHLLACDQRQLGLLMGTALREDRAKGRDDRSQEKKAGEHRRRDQALVALGKANERD